MYIFDIKRVDSFIFIKLRNFKQPILPLINENRSGLISLKIFIENKLMYKNNINILKLIYNDLT